MSSVQNFETWDTQAADMSGMSDMLDNGFPLLSKMAIFDMAKHSQKLPPHSSHPDFGHLTVLVFQAVLEVVFVALPGFIVARQGLFDAENQKFLANLNVQLFTPCLIFYKLSSQLRKEDLPGLALIPVIFILQTIVSYLCARAVSYFCGFKKRPTNFVIAMAVFGNSNSLPISLVTSLAFTIKGLHWSKEPHDNDASVSSRGITYLVLFQQLGQLLRWSWGYRVLLAPPEMYKDEDQEEHDRRNSGLESGRYRDEPGVEEEAEMLVDISDDELSPSTSHIDLSKASSAGSRTAFESGAATPLNRRQYTNSSTSLSSCSTCDGQHEPLHFTSNPNVMPTPANGNVVGYGASNFAGHDEIGNGHSSSNGRPYKPHDHWPPHPDDEDEASSFKVKCKRAVKKYGAPVRRVGVKTGALFRRAYSHLPMRLQKFLNAFGSAIWENLNPPLVAMLLALPVVLVPSLKHLLYEVEFFEHSITRAIKQSGDVAVPLIIVVLGANLARNTLPKEQQGGDDPKFERKLLIASLIARMLLPMLVMAPILTLLTRFLPVNILGDPIFIIVCYLLAGAPSALQLAQICQINNVYMGTMTGLLFHSYVIWILPSTLILVMLALETLEWAQQANS